MTKTYFEINKAVAEKLGLLINEGQGVFLKPEGSGVLISDATKAITTSVFVNDIISTYEVNFCESWADAGPLIEKYRISIVNITGTTAWMACSDCSFIGKNFNCKIYKHNTNPKVAAMLVFLDMEIDL